MQDIISSKILKEPSDDCVKRRFKQVKISPYERIVSLKYQQNIIDCSAYSIIYSVFYINELPIFIKVIGLYVISIYIIADIIKRKARDDENILSYNNVEIDSRTQIIQ